MSLTKYATYGEAAKTRKIVDRALELGFTVSVNDSYDCDGEWVVKRSTNRQEILDALASTGGDTLRIRQTDKTLIGDICLIYGNDPHGEELVADHTDNAIIAQIVS